MILGTTIIWNVIRIFFQIFLFHMRNEWMILTETLLYICHTFYVLRPMFTVFLVWHPLECERDDSIDGGGKSMWKRKGFENVVEMASIHHDEDSPIHNIWSLHGVVVETPTLATHNFQPFVNELPKRSPCTTVPTTTNPSITIILDFISPKSLQPCHTLCPFRWLGLLLSESKS